jgi:hypothetical protein
VDLTAWEGAELVLGNYPPAPGPGLRPWEVKVLRRTP